MKCLPSAIIRYGDKPVSFEMCDPMGVHNHLFTLEEHRRKGLGTTVELRLSQKCIKLVLSVIWNLRFLPVFLHPPPLPSKKFAMFIAYMVLICRRTVYTRRVAYKNTLKYDVCTHQMLKSSYMMQCV